MLQSHFGIEAKRIERCKRDDKQISLRLKRVELNDFRYLIKFRFSLQYKLAKLQVGYGCL